MIRLIMCLRSSISCVLFWVDGWRCLVFVLVGFVFGFCVLEMGFRLGDLVFVWC